MSITTKNMLLKVWFNKKNINSKKSVCEYATQKPIIVVPKKSIKLASKRNKIRRQIRAILYPYRKQFQQNIIIRYFDTNIQPNFQDLKKEILKNISLYTK